MDDRDTLATTLDREHVFHSWSAQATLAPIVVAGGLGTRVWDHSGRSYLDFSSQLVNVNIGHQHPKIIAAITKLVRDVPMATLRVHPNTAYRLLRTGSIAAVRVGRKLRASRAALEEFVRDGGSRDEAVVPRAERVVLIGVAALAFGEAWNGLVLKIVIALLAVLTNLTAFQRIVWVYKNARGVPLNAHDAAQARELERTSKP